MRLVRHGGRHDWYRNATTGVSQPFPRHREIEEHLARHIIRQLTNLSDGDAGHDGNTAFRRQGGGANEPSSALTCHGMFTILLLAANLAAFRYLPWPALDFTPLYIALGLHPMLNVLVILGYRYVRNPGIRHPWAMPLFIFGPLAMLAHVSWVKLYPDQVSWICNFPNGVFFRFCKAYRMPDYVAVSPEGYSYFRYYPAIVLLKFSVLQLTAVGFGRVCYNFAAQFRNGRVLGAMSSDPGLSSGG